MAAVFKKPHKATFTFIKDAVPVFVMINLLQYNLHHKVELMQNVCVLKQRAVCCFRYFKDFH